MEGYDGQENGFSDHSMIPYHIPSALKKKTHARSITDNILREVSTLQSSMIRSFDREVSSIDGILKLTLGEPDFDTPGK